MEETSVTAYLRVPRCTSKAQPKSSSFSSEMLFSPAGYEPVDFYVCALVCMCVCGWGLRCSYIEKKAIVLEMCRWNEMRAMGMRSNVQAI